MAKKPAIKLDKEFILKHQFWILLGASLFFALVPVFFLLTSVGEEIDVKQRKLQEELASYKPHPPENLSSEKNNEALEETLKQLQKLEQKAWESAYKAQEPLFTWPKKVEDDFNFINGLFAAEIKVHSAKGLQDLPPDDEHQVSGKIVSNSKDFIFLTDRKGTKHKIYRTEPAVRIQQVDKENASLPFSDLAPGSVVHVLYERGHYFMDLLTNSERDEFIKGYLQQIHPILQQVQPMNAKGEGVVQLRGWPYREGDQEDDFPPADTQFLHYLRETWDRNKDISQAAWIAQEDLWIQREVYRLIRMANDYVSNFEGKGGNKENVDYSFKNPFWDVKVRWLGAEKYQVSFTNLLPRRQRLDLRFFLKTTAEGEPDPIFLEGEPLEAKGGEPGKNVFTKEFSLPKGIKRTGIFGVQQALTWETAAVRRIDRIVIAHVGDGQGGGAMARSVNPFAAPTVAGPPLGRGLALAHRLFGEPLKHWKQAAAPKEDANAQPLAKGEEKKTEKGPDPLPNKFIRQRYLDTTEQLRRIPVAVSLIVDQDHVDRVQSAFNNSQLRFLTNQVVMAHYADSVRPQVAGDKEAAPPMGGEGFFQKKAEGTGQSASAGVENNIEMVIYGTFTLYERFPPKFHLKPNVEEKAAEGQ